MRLLLGLVIVLSQSLFANQLYQDKCKDFVKRELPRIPGWCSAKKAAAMMDLIFEITPDTCVEMGVFGGSSLFASAYALKSLNHGMMYAIDAWDANEAIRYYPMESIHRAWWASQKMDVYYNACINLIARHSLNSFCIIYKMTFAEALKHITSIDILHIDATHTNEGDFIDAVPYIQKVKKMGYIWFDGWSNSFDTYEYLKSRCHIKKVVDSGNCILLQKMVEN